MRSSSPPRRRAAPRQQRSRATLDAIVVAATRIFAAEGYEHANINAIATAAGVSPGTLYQYVPTKAALAELVMKRRSDEIVSFLEPRLLELASLPLREGVAKAMRVLVEAHRMHEKLPSLPFSGLPEEGPLAALRDLVQRTKVALRVYFEAHAAQIRPRNLELAVVLLATSIDAAIHEAIHVNPTWADDGQLEAELVAIVLGYLQPQEPG
jgi:AcrR family transcriptional regulator